jgi:hypothetical protein
MNDIDVTSVSGSHPLESPHKGGDSVSACHTGNCGGGGGAGGSGSTKIGGVGVHVAVFNLNVGGGGAGADRYGAGNAFDGGGTYRYSLNSPNSHWDVADEYPHGVDGTGGGGGGARQFGSKVFASGGYGASGVVMLRHRTADGPIVIKDNVKDCESVCSMGCTERVGIP